MQVYAYFIYLYLFFNLYLTPSLVFNLFNIKCDNSLK